MPKPARDLTSAEELGRLVGKQVTIVTKARNEVDGHVYYKRGDTVIGRVSVVVPSVVVIVNATNEAIPVVLDHIKSVAKGKPKAEAAA